MQPPSLASLRSGAAFTSQCALEMAHQEARSRFLLPSACPVPGLAVCCQLPGIRSRQPVRKRRGCHFLLWPFSFFQNLFQGCQLCNVEAVRSLGPLMERLLCARHCLGAGHREVPWGSQENEGNGQASNCSQTPNHSQDAPPEGRVDYSTEEDEALI